MRDRLVAAAAAPPASIHVIHNGVDLTRFHPTPRGFDSRIGMVCRVTPLKRVYEAILTIGSLRSQGHPFTLHVAGPMDDQGNPRYQLAVRRLVTKLRLTDCVSFYGQVDDIPAWLAQIDVFLSNSYWEGLSLALLEAMASGCFCLAHCYGGAEEVLPSESVFTTDSELRARLLAYARFSEREKQQVQEKMRLITEQHFDERRMVQEITEVVEHAVST
jgi:glycosyltransferase involved in cell wall biosynthesis